MKRGGRGAESTLERGAGVGAPVSYSAASTPCSDGASSATAIDRGVYATVWRACLEKQRAAEHFDFDLFA